MLAIIGAMEEEVSQLKALMTDVVMEKRAGMEFYQGLLKNKAVVIVRCGIGKVNAAICTQILAERYQPDAIINTGIAGGLKKEIHIGDIVLSTDALQHDVDAAAFGYPLGQIPRMDYLSFPADNRLLALAKACCQQVNQDISVFTGRVLSGDQFISSREKKEWLTESFQGSCVEMEGGAIAQTACLNEIPFLIIRAISDNADDSAGMNYQEFEAQAIVRSVSLTLAIVENY